MPPKNYRLVAVQFGDRLKYDTTVNEVKRIAGAVFRFPLETFDQDGITSIRAKLVYDGILTLAKQRMDEDERDKLLVEFCTKLAPESARPQVASLLLECGIAPRIVNRENLELFVRRSFHAKVVEHSQRLFLQGNYFHAVFEACKVFNVLVKGKSQSEKDGQALMLDVWSPGTGVLKITPCLTETDRNVQDGVKFLSAGLMQAIRNPTAHEPALDWPISREDALDILSFVSFLFRQLDKATYFKA